VGAQKIRLHDEIVVIAGKDRGKRGKVTKVLTKSDRVVVEGVNMVTRHLRRNPQNPQLGGRIQRSAPLHVSNVMLWSASDQKGVRARFDGEGRAKRRVAAKSGAPVGGAAGKRN
jgi:large subunit ribosomal protein L24